MPVRVEYVLPAVAAVTLLIGLSRAMTGNASTDAHVDGQWLPVTSSSALSIDSLTRLADATIENDPFRLSNTPPSARLSAPPAQRAPAPPKPPRPTLVLRGVVGGPPWRAIVDGLPGALSSTVVRVGDHVGDLTIRSIRRDTVIVVAKDTTWKLLLARP